MQTFRPGGFSLLPPVIKNLLIINGLFFLGRYTMMNLQGFDLNDTLGLYFPLSNQFKPFQIVTHMFMHGSISHIFFNMFALWMFGNAIENIWGPKKFLTYYIVTGLGASLIYTLVNVVEYNSLIASVDEATLKMIKEEGFAVFQSGQNYADPTLGALNRILNGSVVGASGAVFGILLAFGMTFPNTRIYLYFAIPIKAKYFVIGYGLLELYNGIATSHDGIAHSAHLGGMIFGYFLIRYWNRNQFRVD